MVVLDSNVWISALVFGGNPRQVLQLALAEGVGVAVSGNILNEVRRKLRQKFPVNFYEDFEDVLVVFGPRLQHVNLGKHTVTICRDPKDNMVIETALAAGASIVVTGDKDLLTLHQYEGVSFITPAEYVKGFEPST